MDTHITELTFDQPHREVPLREALDSDQLMKMSRDDVDLIWMQVGWMDDAWLVEAIRNCAESMGF